MGFLNEQRKADLITKLGILTMPPHYSAFFAGWEEREVDTHLAAAVLNCLKWSKDYVDLPKDAPTEEAATLAQFVLADLVIMDVYSDEIKDRGLTGSQHFPVFRTTLDECIHKIDELASALEGEEAVYPGFSMREKAAELGLSVNFPETRPTLH